MKPLGAKENKDLFFHYLVAFAITAGALLAALFLTRNENLGTSGMDEQTQRLFNEFDRFDKSKLSMERLIDTVTAVGNQIIIQNNEGTLDPVKTANDLINDFEKNGEDSDVASNPFAANVVKLLRFDINSKSVIKAKKDQVVVVEQELKDCMSKLQQKNQLDILKQLIQQNQNMQGEGE